MNQKQNPRHKYTVKIPEDATPEEIKEFMKKFMKKVKKEGASEQPSKPEQA